MRILSPAKVLKGKVSINRTSSNYKDDYITIELTDDSSGCTVTNIEISMQEFALAVTGLSARPCEFEWYTNCPVGKRREIKTEIVEVPTYDTREVASKYLKPYEIDGWIGYVSDIGNMHRRVQSAKDGWSGFRVTFTRFVDNFDVIAS